MNWVYRGAEKPRNQPKTSKTSRRFSDGPFNFIVLKTPSKFKKITGPSRQLFFHAFETIVRLDFIGHVSNGSEGNAKMEVFFEKNRGICQLSACFADYPGVLHNSKNGIVL